jgi:hypothetical protein
MIGLQEGKHQWQQIAGSGRSGASAVLAGNMLNK